MQQENNSSSSFILPLFRSVQIETTGICNRRCVYCPNVVGGRETGTMSSPVYYHIVDNLGKIGFKGRISLHGYGEPLLDPEIITRVRDAKMACPNAYIGFSSNGDFLTLDILRSLLEVGLEHMLITQCDTCVREEISSLIERAGEAAQQCVHIRSEPRFIMNRTGLVHVTNNSPGSMYCPRPFEQAVVDWKGRVVLCCCDYYSQQVMGDTRVDDLKYIWNGEAFRKARATLLSESRLGLPLCNVCNYPPFSEKKHRWD